MEISKDTVEILRNFATINPNIVFNQGNLIKSVKPGQAALAKAYVSENFPQTFGIYDLNEFLLALTMFGQESVRLSFHDNHVVIADSSGLYRTSYYFIDPELVASSTTDKEVVMPKCQLKFSLDKRTLNYIRKSSSGFGLDYLVVSPKGNNLVELKVTELKKQKDKEEFGNAFVCEVPAEFESDDFRFTFLVSNFKMIDGDYDVEVSNSYISHFTNKEQPIEYWVATER